LKRNRFFAFLKDKKGVSDAFVMLLLLAIGAAVVAGIGAMLLTKAPKSTAPVASLSIYPLGSDVIIEHKSGDVIRFSEIRIVAYNYPEMKTVDNYPTTADIPEKEDNPPRDVFNAGDVIKLRNLGTGSYKIVLIHIPTGQTIAEQVVTVSESAAQ